MSEMEAVISRLVEIGMNEALAVRGRAYLRSAISALRGNEGFDVDTPLGMHPFVFIGILIGYFASRGDTELSDAELYTHSMIMSI